MLIEAVAKLQLLRFGSAEHRKRHAAFIRALYEMTVLEDDWTKHKAKGTPACGSG